MFGVCEVGSDFEGPGHIKCHIVDGVIKREIVAVAHAKNISLDYDEIMGFLKIQIPKAGTHYPSMAQDVMKKRLTEIESIFVF